MVVSADTSAAVAFSVLSTALMAMLTNKISSADALACGAHAVAAIRLQHAKQVYFTLCAGEAIGASAFPSAASRNILSCAVGAHHTLAPDVKS